MSLLFWHSQYHTFLYTVDGALVLTSPSGFYHLNQGRVDGKMAGWQWMTVCLSLLSFIASGEYPPAPLTGVTDRRLTLDIGLVLWLLPDSPTRAKWASEEDKVKFVERVRRNDQGIKQKMFRKDQMWEALTGDIYSWLLFFLVRSHPTMCA